MKTKMLRALGQNFVLDGGILRLDLKKPYLRIKNGLQEVPIDKAMLELARNPTRQAVTATERVAVAKLSRWSSLVNDALTAVKNMKVAFFVPDYSSSAAY